jgi:hypothetical protein
LAVFYRPKPELSRVQIKAPKVNLSNRVLAARLRFEAGIALLAQD